MPQPRPRPPRPQRVRRLEGSFSWIDHRFLRQGFHQGLSPLEKLLYFMLIAVSNQDGVSFYSDRRLGELLDVRYLQELIGARNELTARDLIAFESGIYQVLQLPARPLPPGHDLIPSQAHRAGVGSTQTRVDPDPGGQDRGLDPPSSGKTLGDLLRKGRTEDK